MQTALEAGTIRVLTSDGATAGTGFLVSNSLALTCAHVIQSVGIKPGELLTIKYHLTNQTAQGRVLTEAWSAEEDVAVIELLDSPAEDICPIHMQFSAGLQGERFQTLGYPQDGSVQVRWAQGEILGLVPVEGYSHPLLQIDGNQIDKGLSGAPLIDFATRRVVGIITGYLDVVRSTSSPPLRMAYAIPMETVSEIFPALKQYIKVREPRADYLEERELTKEDLAYGLNKLAELLPERAPILLNKLSALTKTLQATLGASHKALSRASRKERAEAIDELNSLSAEVLDLSFPALCSGQTPPDYDSRSPFRGLESFRPEDHEFFFGREDLTNRLIQKLKEHRFLALLGASGSGKSSLVMAGLIPSFGKQYIAFRPGAEPLTALETALVSSKEDMLLVVDQFEELFTPATRDSEKRLQFISRLLDNAGRLFVVITMRADFLGEIAPYARLREQIETRQIIIPAMDAPELLSAITGQAHQVGLRFEGDLSQQMLEDVTGEPGAMPLLQHAAWILWQRRHGRWLRAEEYRAFGGVKQAIASTAEEVYAQCTESERKRMRDIFLRLTRLDDAPTGLHRDTRRRVAIRDLIPAGNESNLTLRLLDKLASARLVVKTETEVEVAHETLIQHWDRLKDWLENDRNTLIIYQHLRQRASEWAQGGHIPDLLYPPSRLKQIDNLQKSGYLLNANETAFVTASQARRKSLILQKYALWISALVLAGIVLVAFPLRLAYYAVLRQQVLKESPMVELKGGNIKFGTDDPNRFSDEPVLETRYVETFFLETTEVTNAKYRVCVKVGICKEPKDTAHYDLASYNDHPVVQVTLDQAIAYCAWLGRRLPDTYEWERAARGLAEESRLWPWGDSPPSRENANIILPLGSNQWYAPKDTQPVGFLKPGKTSEGVFDLVGNVWEWTSTQISEGVYVQRGGSWNSTMERVTKIKTIDAQHQLSPDQAVGFRCAQ